MNAEERRIVNETEQQQVTGGAGISPVIEGSADYELIMGKIRIGAYATARELYKMRSSHLSEEEKKTICDALYDKFGYHIDQY